MHVDDAPKELFRMQQAIAREYGWRYGWIRKGLAQCMFWPAAYVIADGLAPMLHTSWWVLLGAWWLIQQSSGLLRLVEQDRIAELQNEYRALDEWKREHGLG